MNGVIYLVGLVVIVLFLFLGDLCEHRQSFHRHTLAADVDAGFPHRRQCARIDRDPLPAYANDVGPVLLPRHHGKVCEKRLREGANFVMPMGKGSKLIRCLTAELERPCHSDDRLDQELILQE